MMRSARHNSPRHRLNLAAGAGVAVIGALAAALAWWTLRRDAIVHSRRGYRPVQCSGRAERAGMTRAPHGLVFAIEGIVVAAALVAGLAWRTEHRAAIELTAEGSTGGDIGRAVPLMLANGCAGCHTINGVPGARGQVGPRLDSALGARVYIAGTLPNTPANMITWLRFSRRIQPHTGMPSTGISEQDARDIAAYLYALR